MEKFEKDATYAKIADAQSGDEAAKSLLVEENMGLVLSIAKRFYNRGYDKDDINQLGLIGLLRAIEKFDLGQDVRFSTYAVPQIMGEIKRFLRDDGPIKVSRSIKQVAAQIAYFVEKEQITNGTTPGVNDISKALGISVEEIVAAQEATQTPESIFSERDNGNMRLETILSDNACEECFITKIDIRAAISSLPQRERIIIAMRYFLDKPQKDIAKKLGISQVQVSRLEKKILEKLKKSLACES